jgi:hypothetical protein
MKDSRYTETICRDFCNYFKKGKEELKCGGYEFLIEHLTLKELLRLSDKICTKGSLKRSVPADNQDLFDMVCSRCDFMIDGCDYRDGVAAPPCGGYILINELMRR